MVPLLPRGVRITHKVTRGNLPVSYERFTDSGQAAQACREEFAGKYIHAAGVGWLKWDGKVWREVPDKVPLADLRRWTTSRLAADLGGDPVKWARRLDTSKLKNALTLLEGFEEISVEAGQLDANPDLLNVRNGIVCLHIGGELIPHDPRQYMTKLADVDYVPTAIHEDWTAALSAVPLDVQDWLQTRYGQAITGHMCPDDRVVIQQGGGQNGKSTLLAGIAAALGDYYHAAPARLLMGGQNPGATPDLADLRGRRFAAIEETPESGRLDVVGLKNLAGTLRITARKLYRDPVTFPASHTLFVNTNYPPQVAETDEGTWRRLLLVEFPYTFTGAGGDTERPGDPRLRARLSGPEQARAALAWLVEGAVRWYENRREFPDTPSRVREASEDWRWSTDHVVTFWNDYLDPDPDSYIYTGDLIWLFNQFMMRNGNARVAESTFVRRFENHKMTAAHAVGRTRLSQGPRQSLTQSRPHGSLDPHARMPGAPTGQVWCWTGIRFRMINADALPADQRFW